MSPNLRQTTIFAALVTVLAGYFLVWLPNEAAGLSFIGLEMAEQAKFLPQVRSGAIVPGRSLFYAPPITIALILILMSSCWPSSRWQTWSIRLIAAGISVLAFPAYEALGTEAAEWLWRVLAIGLVFVLAILSPFLGRLPIRARWALIGFVAVCGALLPGWVLLEVRAAFASLQRISLGIGVGYWLNLGGLMMIAALAFYAMLRSSTIRAVAANVEDRSSQEALPRRPR